MHVEKFSIGVEVFVNRLSMAGLQKQIANLFEDLRRNMEHSVRMTQLDGPLSFPSRTLASATASASIRQTAVRHGIRFVHELSAPIVRRNVDWRGVSMTDSYRMRVTENVFRIIKGRLEEFAVFARALFHEGPTIFGSGTAISTPICRHRWRQFGW